MFRSDRLKTAIKAHKDHRVASALPGMRDHPAGMSRTFATLPVDTSNLAQQPLRFGHRVGQNAAVLARMKPGA